MAVFSIIACDHGFGHVRRSLLVASGLAEAGHDVTVFASAAAVARFPAPPASVRLVDFATHTSVAGLRSGAAAAVDWHRTLPDLTAFDLVVSDNLPEVLLARPDAVLSGGFLWHQALADMDGAAAARARDLLERHRPPMITSALFAAPELLAATRAEPVGLVVDQPPLAVPAGTDLLIVCGGSAEAEADYAAAVAALATGGGPPTGVTVWVEPRLVPADAPGWMKPAVFGAGFHARLAACVCRPGVGTLTDCLWAQARVFTAHEAGNGEMAFNARRVAEAGVGEACRDAESAVAAALAYIGDAEARAEHLRSLAVVDFGGLQQTVAVLDRLVG